MSTVLGLKLNRPELIEDRVEHIKALRTSLEAIEKQDDVNLRNLMLTALSDDPDTGKPEYIAMRRAILTDYTNKSQDVHDVDSVSG